MTVLHGDDDTLMLT